MIKPIFRVAKITLLSSIALSPIAAHAQTASSGGSQGGSPGGGALSQTASASSKETISGTVTVAPAVSAKVHPTGVLFIIARKAGTKGGAPAAVLRVPSPKFPLTFELGPQHVMLAGSEFKGDFDVTVKLSKTGDAITAPGDLLGATDNKKPVAPGAKAVKLTLSTVAP